jgi:hypothetical protein
MANATKKKTVKTVLIVLALLLLINIPPLNIPFILIDRDDCRFSNGDGSFTFREITVKEHNYATSCKGSFSSFKERVHAGESGFVSKDTMHLYRVTSINPLKVWHYRAYLFNEKYKVSYADWKEINANRGQYQPNGYQDF